MELEEFILFYVEIHNYYCLVVNHSHLFMVKLYICPSVSIATFKNLALHLITFISHLFHFIDAFQLQQFQYCNEFK